MKRRIISSVLVVVMLVLSLASCAHDYSKDYESCVTFGETEKKAFEDAMKVLTVEDGEFTKDEATRALKVLDTIYKDLAGDVDKNAKITEGVIGGYDMLYYCYYITYTETEGEGESATTKEITVYAASMKESSAVSFQLGLSSATDLQKKIADAILGDGTEGSGFGDFKDNVYKTTTSSSTEVKEGDVVYVTYKATTSETSTTYTNIKLVAKDDAEANGIHNDVAKALVGTKVTKAKDSFKSADESITYTGAVVNWIVDGGKEAATVTDTTYEKETKVTDVEGVSRDLNGKELTYHIYPVYYLEVEDYTAETVFKSLISSLSTSSLACLKDAKDVVDAYNKAVTDLDTAEKALEDAEKNVTSAQSALTTAEGKIPEGETKETNTNYQNALKALEQAKATRDGKKTDKENAEKKVDEEIVNIFKKVGAEDVEAGKATVKKDYEKTIYDELLTAYNEEVKMNLAKAVYDLMIKYAVIDESKIPEKAIDEAYDDIYEAHEYTFYTGKDSDNKTHYANHNGKFRSYLLEVTATKNIKDAKAALREDAKEYVTPIIQFYAVAGAYDQLTTKKELKEYKKGDFEYNKYYNGENNALVAYQFDKLMNYFLAVEEKEVAEGEEAVVEDAVYTHEFFKGRDLITKAEEK